MYVNFRFTKKNRPKFDKTSALKFADFQYLIT